MALLIATLAAERVSARPLLLAAIGFAGAIFITNLRLFYPCWALLVGASLVSSQSRRYSAALTVLFSVGAVIALSEIHSWWLIAGFSLSLAATLLLLADLRRTEYALVPSILTYALLWPTGVYGLLRFAWPVALGTIRTPRVMLAVAALSLVVIVYTALISLRQRDLPGFIAFSTIAQLGYVTLGAITLTPLGLQGAMLQQFVTILSTTLLLLLTHILQTRCSTTAIAGFSGLFRVMPRFTLIFLAVLFSDMATPAFAGFIGKFAILTATAERSLTWSIWMIIGLILSAGCLIWLFHRICLGTTLDTNFALPDLSRRELALSLPIVGIILAIGLYPQPLFQWLAPVAQQILYAPRP